MEKSFNSRVGKSFNYWVESMNKLSQGILMKSYENILFKYSIYHSD